MKICFFSRLFWPNESGAEKTVRELAEDLAKKGHSVDVVTTRRNNQLLKNERINDYNIFRLYWGKTSLPIIKIGVINYLYYDFLYFFQIRKLIIKHKYDILACSDPISFGIPISRLSKIFNISLIK